MEEQEFNREELLDMLDGGLHSLSDAIVSLIDGGEVDGEELGLSYMRWALPASLLAHQLAREGEAPEGLSQLMASGPQLDAEIQVFLQQPSREGLQKVAATWMSAREGSQILLESLD